MVLQQGTHTASLQHEVVKRASYIVAFEPFTLQCIFGTTMKQTHMRFHRMHVMTSTAMEATKPMDAERIMTTSMANETP